MRLDGEGIWRATHIYSRREIDGATWAELLDHAFIVRTIEGLKRAVE